MYNAVIMGPGSFVTPNNLSNKERRTAGTCNHDHFLAHTLHSLCSSVKVYTVSENQEPTSLYLSLFTRQTMGFNAHYE